MSLGLILVILFALLGVGILWWTALKISHLQSQMTHYADYVTKVREQSQKEVLSEEFMQELRNHARLNLDNALQSVNEKLKENLQHTYKDLTNALQESAQSAMKEELAEYQKALEVAKDTALKIVAENQTSLDKVRKEVEEQASKVFESEKQRLMNHFRDNLEDIVSEYLLQVLGENVDLGAQRGYVFAKLEEHRDDFIKDLNDEV